MGEHVGYRLPPEIPADHQGRVHGKEIDQPWKGHGKKKDSQVYRNEDKGYVVLSVGEFLLDYRSMRHDAKVAPPPFQVK